MKSKPKEQSFDPVQRPEHYTGHGVECIDAMLLLFPLKEVVAFCKLNAFKYRYRAPFKGQMEQDIEKADWYLNKVRELETKAACLGPDW